MGSGFPAAGQGVTELADGLCQCPPWTLQAQGTRVVLPGTKGVNSVWREAVPSINLLLACPQASGPSEGHTDTSRRGIQLGDC